ncbi:unnamed protein product [Onchocerca ochengi]|uniref:60S ribosomal protein L13a n=1 Tax=Onchocerca ochengi TaxID=42157 RepID=A0A182EHN0_ONCOC|nr:unnamed protein product [Onchocerca ochengi]
MVLYRYTYLIIPTTYFYLPQLWQVKATEQTEPIKHSYFLRSGRGLKYSTLGHRIRAAEPKKQLQINAKQDISKRARQRMAQIRAEKAAERCIVRFEDARLRAR